MIRNERQYRVTLAERDRLTDQRQTLPTADVPAWVRKASRDALTSQIIELDEALAEYEALQVGHSIAAEPVHELAALPRALIRARIAAGMTQRDLADRVGVREQQIQRYEADDYAGANLTRLQAVVDALDVEFDATLTISPESGRTSDQSLNLRRTLRSLGLSSKILSRRFFAATDTGREAPADWLGAASRAARIFDTDLDHLLSGNVAPTANAGAFRASSAASVHDLNGYARYAQYLAELLQRACMVESHPLPSAQHLHARLSDQLREAPFEVLLEVCWEHGVPVLPLSDAGAFHGACWNFPDGPVIALKNNVRSPDRWAFLLAHEMNHAANPEGGSVIEQGFEAHEWRQRPAERRADEFAADILLASKAEAMIQVAVREADNDVARLKSVLPVVAEAAGVSTGVLADHMAFRLDQSGVQWWSTAIRLHDTTHDAWKTARSKLFEHIDLTRLDALDREILIDGIAP